MKLLHALYSRLLRRSSLVALALLGLAGGLWVLLKPAAPAPIRVGVLHSLSGTMAASERPLVDGLRLAAEEINAAGGLLGRPVELVVVDGRSDWAVFAREAERLIVEEQVNVLFACWTSACRKVVRPVVERHQHLMFYPVQYEGLEQSPNIIYTGAAPNQQIIPGARWAIDTFGGRVFLVGSDYVFPRTANVVIRDLVTAGGGSVLAELYEPLGSRDFSAMISEIARLRPDVILNTINGDSNQAFFAALQAAGLQQIPVISFSVAEPELQVWPELAAHPLHFAVWGYFQSLPGAANQAFVERFRKRFGADRVISDPVEASYNGLRLWANTVQELGSLAPAEVNLAVLRQSVPGPSGQVAVDAATRHVWRWVHVGQAQPNGQFRRVHGSAIQVRPTPFPPYRSTAEWERVVNRLSTPVKER